MFNFNVQDYVRAKGIGSLMSLAHRVSGITIVLYMLFHIYTLSGLCIPVEFAEHMELFNNPLCSFLE